MVNHVKKILISIHNNNIIFSYKTNNSSISNDLINTNIISNNELIFSDIYIKENSKILASFIKELSIQYNSTKVIITKMDLAPLILNLLKKATAITEIEIKEDESLTYEVCELLIDLNHIKNITCYTMQPFMIELLDKNGITCSSRCEILYLSNFMEKNNLLRYSNIYYKTNIRITFPLSLEDLKDFEDFLKINKYLKIIHVNKLINSELENLVNILIKHNRNNLKIVIHENITDEKKAEYLRNKNKTYKKKYKIYLSLEYTKEYLDKNIFKQAITNTLKVCGLIVSSLVILIVTYIGVSNYIALKQVNAIKEDLAEVIEDTDPTDISEQKNEENLEQAEIEEKPIDDIKLITNTKLASLLTVNEDVVGELIVNNTNVNYPVVQAEDNDYYLTRNINKEKNANDWIYLDFRNDSMNLDKNNIIYGHNMYYSGVMFGTLYKTYNSNWYMNPENQMITYNTLYDNMKFQIFSIYKVPETNDYLKVFFDGDNDFLAFITMITKRSIYDFNVPIDADDKIITLSTCSNNGTKRLVIHAVLLDE